jgi:hypothetical protein
MDRVEIQPAIDAPRILGRLTVFVDVNLAKHVGQTKSLSENPCTFKCDVSACKV